MTVRNLPIVEYLNQEIQRIENLLCITRNSDLQRQALASLEGVEATIRTAKDNAIADNDEDLANLLLGFQCVAEALSSELEMWLLLKDEEPDSAWDNLVAAQMSSIDAARAHSSFSHLTRNNERLEAIEKIVFPPQVFVSAGMVVKSQTCSICGQEYEECSHLIGRPYMGELCYVIAKDFSIDHVAIVEIPADKRCRVTGVPTNDGIRNRMTLRIEQHGNDLEMSGN